MANQESNAGFSLIEVMIAMAVTLIIMASVFALLTGGQDSFRREGQVADMQMSARAGLDTMSRDLTVAGNRTPPASAIFWSDGGGIQPDQITIVYADPDAPVSLPPDCGTGPGATPCGFIGQASPLVLDANRMEPLIGSAQDAYAQGMILSAIETEDCNADGLVGFLPFRVIQPPVLSGGATDPTLDIGYDPGTLRSELNIPNGFNDQVREDCAVVGLFHMVSYRVSPPPPVGNPTLERRDLTVSTDWLAVAHNIENLQLRFGIGGDSVTLVDAPFIAPSDDPLTWINRVDVTVTGRTEDVNLKGATAGVFDAADTYVRKSVSSQVGLRNVVYAAANQSASY